MLANDRPTVLVVTGEDSTADLVIDELNHRGVRVTRFDYADLPDRLIVDARFAGIGSAVSGTIETPSRVVQLEHVRAVYYRRPNWPQFEWLSADQALFARDQVRFGLEGLLHGLRRCRFVNHPRRQQAAEYKPAQLAVAADLGFSVPSTVITNSVERAREFIDVHRSVVYKPLASAAYMIDGEPKAVWVREVDSGELDDSIGTTLHLFQARVNKSADVRVTVLGERVFCVRIDSPLLDWRERYDLIKRYEVVEPPPGLSARVIEYLRRFGLTYGCFDFGIDRSDGTWWWYECNPGGEWGWIAAETGLPIAAATADLLAEGTTAA